MRNAGELKLYYLFCNRVSHILWVIFSSVFIATYICCCHSVGYERSPGGCACINITITWWSFASCRGVDKFYYPRQRRQPADLRSRSNWITDSWRTCCAVLWCLKPNEGLCGLCKTKRRSQAVGEQIYHPEGEIWCGVQATSENIHR